MSEKKNLAGIRNDYKSRVLNENEISKAPIQQFEKWLNEAINSQVLEATAMVLSTISYDNRPSSRVVLLKNINEKGLTFFTNYKSKKGTDLAHNPAACINFFWPELERQVRIEGKIEIISSEESDEYFHSRPRQSQISAFVSPQSKVIESRLSLESTIEKTEQEFENKEIPRPQHWGGYILIPDYFEFWQGRPSRLHDRISFKLIDNVWTNARLAP